MADAAKKCFLCRKTETRMGGFRNIENRAPHSKKTMRSVISYLAKFGNAMDIAELPTECWICRGCFQYLTEYDEYIIKLLSVQKRLIRLIRDALYYHKKTVVDSKPSEASEESVLEVEHYDLTSDVNEASEVDTCDIDMDMETIDEAEIPIPEHELTDAIKGEEQEEHLEPTAPYCCSSCNLSFKNTASLRHHKKEKHGQKRDGLSCHKCGVKVRDEEYLDLHMNLHEGKTENECRYCPKRYSRKVNVIRHMQLHYDKKKFQCEKCGLRFSQTSALYNHKLLHEAEEQPLVCSICNQTFKTKRTYKGHMMTHREDRPRFPCAFCGKTFVEKYTLKVHLKVHVGDTNSTGSEKRSQEEKATIECIICGSSFTNKDQYNQHMEGQHDVILKTH